MPVLGILMSRIFRDVNGGNRSVMRFRVDDSLLFVFGFHDLVKRGQRIFFGLFHHLSRNADLKLRNVSVFFSHFRFFAFNFRVWTLFLLRTLLFSDFLILFSFYFRFFFGFLNIRIFSAEFRSFLSHVSVRNKILDVESFAATFIALQRALG